MKRFTMEQMKGECMANPAFKQAYEALEGEFQLARELIAARLRAGLTQAQVAERMQTTQSAVARLESGRSVPSSKTLAKFAAATGSRLRITLQPV
jgi:ribosome-binding protein aMBF1 (putative translation factor)